MCDFKVFVENRMEIQLEDKDKGDNWRKGRQQLLWMSAGCRAFSDIMEAGCLKILKDKLVLK